MPYPYTLGAVPSPDDIRDYPLVRRVPMSARLNRHLDHRALMQPVRNQGQEGTCVGHAVAAVMGFHQRNRVAPGKDAPDDEILSPRDIYWQARQRAPVNGDGAEVRAALKIAQVSGALTEAVAPYVEGQRDWQPPSGPGVDVVGDRARNRARTYRRIRANEVESMALAIHQHGPLVYTLEVDDDFAEGGKKGSVIVPRGPKAGWHAVAAIGYDLERGLLVIQNSWGPEWGTGGVAYYDPSKNVDGECYTLDPEDQPGVPFLPVTERVIQFLQLGRFHLDA